MLRRVLAWMLLVPSSASAAFAQERPNVVFILADDLGINDLGCYGRAEHRTPNLDRLAAQGARFTSAYAACSVCSPTRAAILTGKSPARLHLTTFLPGRADAPSQRVLHPTIRQQLPLEEVTLAEHLKAAGYATACVGKWHLGGQGFGPEKQGFDEVHAGKANTNPVNFEGEGGKGEIDLAKAAESFLERNRDRPFFLYLCHNNPHIPLAARQRPVAANKGAFNPTYAAMIEMLDESVGRVLKKLDDLDLADKTLVIFTSDNGGLHVPELNDDSPTHNSPYRAGKGFLYEGGLRVPLIVRWPGMIDAGRKIDDPVISTDWTPTLLNACQIAIRQGYDGISLVNLFRGGTLAPRPLFWHVPHYTNQGGRPAGAIRIQQWKVIEPYDGDPPEFYDLEKDPGESHDLAMARPEHLGLLIDRLKRWRLDIRAQANTPNPDFDEAKFQAIYKVVDVSKLRPYRTAAETSGLIRGWRELIDAAVRKP
ncbi:MAG: sulfatase [Isosphaeraceae bacterium]